MATATEPTPNVDDFLRRWEASGAAERANYALFLTELCDLLGVPRPEPTRPDDADNAYVFERAVTFNNGDGTTSPGRIDLYKRGCFILEAKQGSDRAEASGALGKAKRTRKGTAVRGTAGWDDAMLSARGQAEQYARNLPASEPMPPFLVVVDVGHVIELYADFTRSGRIYGPFPDAGTHRIRLRDLADEAARERLRLVWTDPAALDPSRRSAKVTRDVAARLAKLAQSLERSGQAPEAVAQFLMRCLFTFFAEDVGLLPRDGFTDLLKSLRGQPGHFPGMARSLWETMNSGGFSPALRADLLRFNGGLFESAEALALTDEQLELLIDAGERQWRDVEPAIFGTLLERALDPVERHKLGAHYTPRAYVERLVLPTVIEPLRERWEAVQAAAVTLANEGKLAEAREEARGFLRTLAGTTVLDPACGTGNFLYVTLEHMKRLEGEVWDALRSFGETQTAFEGFGLTVDPHQLRGIEINPRAAAIADLVLWIGFLQWHFRTFGNRMPAEPIIHAYHNIECRDAVLAYDRVEPLTDDQGRPVTRWDGRTTKPHPVTGEPVPDESARVPVERYINPRKAEWPKADYIVGNPPYIGNKRMRKGLGDGYAEVLRSAWPEVPETVDLVMYWWHHAAELIGTGQSLRFGLITTNSIVQTFNRKAVERWLNDGISLVFAIPDHPWVDDADGAAVRVSMTVGTTDREVGRLLIVSDERDGDEVATVVAFDERDGIINADLSIGANPLSARPLRSNSSLSFMGMIPLGSGFWVTREEAEKLGFGTDTEFSKYVKKYMNGSDVTTKARGIYALDLYGLTLEQVRTRFPAAHQWILERVKPQRDQDSRPSYREKWWVFAEARPAMRKALAGLSRYVATVETSRRRFFVFLKNDVLPDQKLRVIATDDAYILGVLSSRAHLVWALVTGSRLGAGNDPVYNNSKCFEPFPFPTVDAPRRATIQRIAEELDDHRKQRQRHHPTLTLRAIYSVLEKLQAGKPLSDKEKTINEQGLVSTLKQLHDDLDAAVFDAYGWPRDLSDDEILGRLVELNRERAAEEARGLVRWLRPEFQHPEGALTATQATLLDTAEPEPAGAAAPAKRRPWPRSLPEQAQAVRSALADHPGGLTPERVARLFQRARADRIADLLETLASLGQARALDDGRFVRA